MQREVQSLLNSFLILTEEWEALPASVHMDLGSQTNRRALFEKLIQHKLLTEYQASRILASKSFGLILGNYRVLERIGAGGMGVIFKAEHIRMRRQVAIKVLPVPRNQNPRSLLRFFAETRAIAQLRHPNIVSAIDAGQQTDQDPDSPILHYLVMEYIPGRDLEALVEDKGPLSVTLACDMAYQVASALAEADKQHLIHRDIKPSNILLTPEGQAKLLDFGLVHHFSNRLTEQHTAMGTLDFMPPEQARDAGAVDIRADIYGLGATLFWCLTGVAPFTAAASISKELLKRQSQTPPSLRIHNSEISEELEGVVMRMMAMTPEDRYQTPISLLRALMPFRKREVHEALVASPLVAEEPSNQLAFGSVADPTHSHRILVVDDETEICKLCMFSLEEEGHSCAGAQNGVRALEAIDAQRFDLILLDIDMPEMNGREVLRHLRAHPPCPHLKVIMLSGRTNSNELAQLLLQGADDYLDKPFGVASLMARVKSSLRLKDAQDRSDLLQRQLLSVNAELEKTLGIRDGEVVRARNALLLVLVKLVEKCDIESGKHLRRIRVFCRCLAEHAAAIPALSAQITPSFIQMLEYCVPLHDIGKICLPDHILSKRGHLDAREQIIMQSHTTLGAEILTAVAEQQGSSLGFLNMAIDIVRHHHERYDGKGYPDRLAGTDIPLTSRIVALADAYDGLRTHSEGNPPMSHSAAVQILTESDEGQFDPLLLHAFQRCKESFERVSLELPE